MSDETAPQSTPQPHPLLTSDEVLRCLVEAAEDYAMVTLDPSGRISDWNRGAERLLGWSRYEATGKPASSILPFKVADGLSTPEAECLRKDGSRFRAGITTKPFHDANGALRAHAIVIRDITAASGAPDARAGDKPWLTTTIDSAMDAIITVNARQQIILFNKAAEAMFHCSASEAHGENLGRFIPQRYREGHIHHVDDFGATGVTSRAMGHLGTLSALRGNGGEFPIEASI